MSSGQGKTHSKKVLSYSDFSKRKLPCLIPLYYLKHFIKKILFFFSFFILFFFDLYYNRFHIYNFVKLIYICIKYLCCHSCCEMSKLNVLNTYMLSFTSVAAILHILKRRVKELGWGLKTRLKLMGQDFLLWIIRGYCRLELGS